MSATQKKAQKAQKNPKTSTPTPFKYRLMLQNADEYPFDKPAQRILRALWRRNWDVPGYKIKWSRHLTGKRKNVQVWAITGPDLTIEFCRRLRGDGYDRPCVAGEIRINGRAIKVYADYCSVNAMLYTGDDWERDKTSFLSDDSCSLYGSCDRSGLSVKRFETLAGKKWKTVDLLPEGLRWNETPSETINAAEFMRRIAWDLSVAAARIERIRKPVFNRNAHQTQNLVKFKSPLRSDLFAFCTWKEYQHVKEVKRRKAVLSEQAYAMSPKDAIDNLQRLYFSNWKPEWGYDLRYLWGRFIWCFRASTGYFNEEKKAWQVSRADLITRGFPVKIKPKYANNIFVIDEDVYWKGLDEFLRNLPAERTHYDIFELKDACRALEASLIPISEYRPGQYKKPLVLIGRELDVDEVELLTPEEIERYKISSLR